MKLLHGNEMHFVRCPDGRVYSTGVAVYAWWSEYLRVFDEVLVAARVRPVNEMYPRERLADGPNVTFHDLPAYRGPEQFLRHAGRVKTELARAVDQADAFVFRVPGTIGYIGARELIRRGRPYGYEVVGDPYDVFTSGSVRHPLRRLFQGWHVRNLRRYTASSCAASYVTDQALQKRYPPPAAGFTTSYSDVGLKPEFYAAVPRTDTRMNEPARLLFVGTLEQLYKAPDILIKAVTRCLHDGQKVHLTIAGEGAMRPRLENLATRLGVAQSVRFAGNVAGREALGQLLDESDLFVLPSRAEGLPRAMLEAMARGVPCIGSTVNGIPELLRKQDLVPPNQVDGLARKIKDVLSDPDRMSFMSAHGLSRAHDFELDRMRARKLSFLRHIRDACDLNHVTPISRRALTV